jgi:hypothetical protein
MPDGELLWSPGQPMPDLRELVSQDTFDKVGASYDLDADGLVETLAFPLPGGGAPFVTDDLSGDGVADAMYADIDGDGVIDAAAIDTNGDGLADITINSVDGDAIAMVDLNADGIVDIGLVDAGSDGVFEVAAAASDFGADALADAAEGSESILDGLGEFISALFG